MKAFKVFVIIINALSILTATRVALNIGPPVGRVTLIALMVMAIWFSVERIIEALDD